MHVVVFSPMDSFTESSIPGLSAEDRVTVVCWASGAAADDRRIVLPRSGAADRMARAASGHVVLRTLLRISPFDPGSVFWRAAKRSPEVARSAMEADILVAPERDGVYAVWNANRRARRGQRRPAAVSGYPAARATIERMR